MNTESTNKNYSKRQQKQQDDRNDNFTAFIIETVLLGIAWGVIAFVVVRIAISLIF